jgi:protein tyrosine/serine phosphatase
MKKRPFTSIRLVVVVLAGVGAVTWATIKLRQASRLPTRFATVAPGKVYRSAQPSPRQLQGLVDDIGLRTLLIVREGGGTRSAAELEYAREHGLNVVHIPVASRLPIPDDQVEAFFRCVDDPRNHPLLVHCSAGRHRTGYLCARYRMDRQGWPLEKALDEMLSFGFDTQDHSAILGQLRNYRPDAGQKAEVMTSAEHEASP